MRVFRTQGGSSRVARWLMAIGVLCTAVPLVSAANAVQAATTPPARSQQLDIGGFPTWYQDANGVRVQPCFDPNDVNCVAPVSATYDPTQPLSFPGNYPDEWFYSAADSAPAIVTDCDTTALTGPGLNGITAHMALEGSFVNGTITAGDQITFGRIRIGARGNTGLCANTWYTFRTPYGPITLQTDPVGQLRGGVAAAVTFDVGCIAATISTPCDFDAALQSEHLKVGLLHLATGAAPGYLGAGVTTGPVVGGKNGFNQFEIAKCAGAPANGSGGFGQDCGTAALPNGTVTDFSVLAKLAGPLTADVTTADFGGQVLGTTSAAKAITISNLGSGALGLDSSTIDSVQITGSADFQLATTSCSIAPVGATPLTRDQSCQISVTFTPSATAVSSASLDIYANGSATPFSVALAGTGILSTAAPAATTSLDNIDFGAVRLTTASGVNSVTITNTGDAPLLAIPSVVASADSSAFRLAGESCSQAYVPAGGTCTVNLVFVPSHVGPYAELLHVQTNLPTGAITVGLLGHATGGVAAVSPTNDPVNTFPDWYQDENGTRVGQCDDPANTLCIAAPVAGPVSFPTNYPDEWFYYLAQSTPIDVSDPACNVAAGPVFVEAGMEAAFLGPIGPNQGITFGRLRIVSRGGLCPNTEYLFTHPYGRTIISVDAKGLIKPTAGTTDVGCLAAPCDYTVALSAPVFEGFLQQDVHPAGYLGDPLAPGTVTGAPYIDPITGQSANHFTIHRLDANGAPSTLIASTTEFGVSGRLVGPMVANPAISTFDGTAVTGGTSTKDVTFTNTGVGPVTVSTVTVASGHTTDFAIAANACDTAVLAPAASCVVSVTFDPTTTGTRTAKLVMTHSGRNNPLEVTVTGTGLAAAGAPAISTPLSTINFVDLQVNQVSASANVVISNVGGNAPLVVGTTPKGGANPGQFQVTNGCPGNNLARPGTVAPGATCTITVRFAPTAAGAKTATLTVNSNAGSITVNLAGKGSTAVAAQANTTNAAGFPSWYQDPNGVRLEPCVAQDGNCVLLADASFNPALPVSWPSNWPGEFFYSLADSETVVVPANASCGGVGGLALVRLATEGSFPALPPVAGAGIFFNRIRVTASGLCPSTTYTFTHPYGVTTLTTDGAGDIKAKAGTFDNANVVGSAPLAPGFLRWDPNVAPAAPTGYIGDSRTLHTVVGSQFRLTPTDEPVNYFAINGPSGLVAKTDKFLLSGRLAGPVVSSLDVKDFGTVEVAKTSTTQVFTFTNVGTTPVSSITTALTGTDAAQFTITANTCTTAGLTLNTDGSCNVTVRFAPAAATPIGVKNATLSFGHNGFRSPVNVALTGTANAVQTPVLTVTPSGATALAFGNVNVNTTSATQIVTIRNSGTGALRLGPISLGGTNPTQYRLVTSSSATVCPVNGTAPTANLTAGTSCTVTVSFNPTTTGSKPASIVVSATDRVTAAGHVAVTIPNQTVSLTGTGAQGTISLSAASTTVRTKAGTTGTARVTLTNTGTAPFSLLGTPFFTVTTVSGTNAALRFTAAQTGCNAVAVGKNCSVTISFTPPAGTAANTVFTVDISMTSNASNNPVKVRVAGTSI